MADLVVAVGLVFVIEGLLYALAPGMILRMMQAATAMPERSLRIGGLVAVAFGVFVVWLVRG